MQLLERHRDVLTGTGELLGEAGMYGPAHYHLTMHDVADESPFAAAPSETLSGLYLEGSIKVEHGVNLLQTLSMTLVLEDGRELDVLEATGEPLAADWNVICTPLHPEQFQAG